MKSRDSFYIGGQWLPPSSDSVIEVVSPHSEEVIATDGQAGVIRYVDLFERRDSEWRIVHRKLVHHPGQVSPVVTEAALAHKAFLARLDTDDPSYDRRPESFLPS